MRDGVLKNIAFVALIILLARFAYINFGSNTDKVSTKDETLLANTATDYNDIVKQPIDRINNDEILNEVNKYREERGKPTLLVSKQLCDYAEYRADFLWRDDMAEIKNSTTGNHSKSKEHLKEWTLSGKLKAGFIDEDIAGNAENSKDVVKIWKDLPTHNVSILRTEYQGYSIKYACIATREASDSNLTILILGDN